MPTIPIEIKQVNEAMTWQVLIDRIRGTIRFVLGSGYYEKDAEGNPVINSLGFPTFILSGSWSWEKEYSLLDTMIQQIMMAADTTARQYIADNPTVPMYAVFDDVLAEMGTNLYLMEKANVEN